MKRKRIGEEGLTLLEVLAVLVIMSILMLIAMPIFLQVIDTSKKQAYIGNALALKDAGGLYTKEAAILNNPAPLTLSYATLIKENYMEEIKDPDTREKWNETNASYIMLQSGKIVAVCLKGHERNICGGEEEEPVAYSDLSKEDVRKN